MKDVILTVEAEMEAIKEIPGVLDCEIDEKTGFQLITVQPGTDYHSIAGALDKAHIEPRNFFIREGEEFVQYNCDTLSFTIVGLETVTAARWHGRLTEALQGETGFDITKILDKDALPPSPQQIITKLEGMGVKHRELYLARHPEHLHLWSNQNDHLNPIV